MSLVVATKLPGGVVLASDRRGTVPLVEGPVSPGDEYFTLDAICKLATFPSPHDRVAVAFTGGGPPGAFYLPEVVERITAAFPGERLPAQEYAVHVGRVLAEYRSVKVLAFVAGVDDGDEQPRVYVVDAPHHLEPVEQLRGTIGLVWSGARAVLDALVPTLNLPLVAMSLDTAAGLSELLIETTARVQQFSLGLECVRDEVDVAVITAEGLCWHRRHEATEPEVTQRRVSPYYTVAETIVRPAEAVADDPSVISSYAVRRVLTAEQVRQLKESKV